ncbi:MAG: phospholipase [Chlorobiaceae bacterium]|nr:phospholipase [Chlorobiaceae bacterium]
MKEHYLRTSVRGRYLVEAPEGEWPFPVLAGFHGYGQTADDGMALLRGIPGSERFLLCAVEALHQFMNAKGEPGASWMTRCDREQRMVENVAYVDAVLGSVMMGNSLSGPIVLHGFSQGVGMACREAALGCYRISAVMLLGGDVPPDLERLVTMRSVHLARGNRDRRYSQEMLEADRQRLIDAGVAVETCVYQGGHAPTEEYFMAAGRFLATLG